MYLIDIKTIKGKDNEGKPIEIHKMIKSTVDHLQYAQLNPGIDIKNLDLLDSWMCFGDTSGFKKLCDRPSKDLGGKK